MITYCIPSKNNLRYLKACIPSIQKNSYYQNHILVFVDKDEDGTVKWLEENNIPYILNEEKECKGIGYAYDTLFKNAPTDYVVAFHADMILGHHADYHLLRFHQPKSVVCSTRIEPPLHPPGPEKIVKDFGMWPEEILWDKFDEFVKEESQRNGDKTTGSSFAPWLIDRREHIGHDPIFLSVFEDADLFRRFALGGYKMIQSWSSLVYHLTCRGGQFLGAEKMEDFQKKDELWLRNNQLSLMEYIRKWGGYFKEWGPCEPRPNKKYEVGLSAKNCTEAILSFEPFFSEIVVDTDYFPYIERVQPNTQFNLLNKFVKELDTDITIEIDCRKTNLQILQQVLMNLEEILEEADTYSNYDIGGLILKVRIKKPIDIKIKI